LTLNRTLEQMGDIEYMYGATDMHRGTDLVEIMRKYSSYLDLDDTYDVEVRGDFGITVGDVVDDLDVEEGGCRDYCLAIVEAVEDGSLAEEDVYEGSKIVAINGKLVYAENWEHHYDNAKRPFSLKLAHPRDSWERPEYKGCCWLPERKKWFDGWGGWTVLFQLFLVLGGISAVAYCLMNFDYIIESMSV